MTMYLVFRSADPTVANKGVLGVEVCSKLPVFCKAEAGNPYAYLEFDPTIETDATFVDNVMNCVGKLTLIDVVQNVSKLDGKGSVLGVDGTTSRILTSWNTAAQPAWHRLAATSSMFGL